MSRIEISLITKNSVFLFKTRENRKREGLTPHLTPILHPKTTFAFLFYFFSLKALNNPEPIFPISD